METEKDFYMPVAIHPGENVREWLEENGMTAAELAHRSGLSEASIRQIAAGLEDITPESAAALERGTNMPADFLLRFQQLYEETAARLEREKAAKAARRVARRARSHARPAELAPAGV